MAAQSYDQLLARLNVVNRDADDFAFTDAEKDEALTSAIENDPWVYIIDQDTSQTTVAAQASYDPIFDEVLDVGYDFYGDGYFTRIPKSSWTVVNGSLIFDRSMLNLAAGKTLIIYGMKHLTKNDQIPQFLQGYVLHLANAALAEILMKGRTNRFLINDITLAEIQASRAADLAAAERIRQTLHNRRPVTF